MAIKPILFNSEMVQAILDGRKTVTRRVIKPSQEIGLKISGRFPEDMVAAKNQLCLPYCEMNDNELIKAIYKHAYEVGDILYVRETWKRAYAEKRYWEFGEAVSATEGRGYVYKADGACLWQDGFEVQDDEFYLTDAYYSEKWRPSIHMPKEAARIWLRVTDVWVERLQDITFEGCLNEGAFVYLSDGYFDRSIVEPEAKNKFGKLWDFTIKKSDLGIYGWAANPWVWVIEFEQFENRPEL